MPAVAAARGPTSPGPRGAVRPDPLEQLFDERRVLIECRAVMTGPRPIPGDPVVRQLRRRQDREALVVGLEQRPFLVQQAVRPLPPIAVDPGKQDEIVIATGDLERVELERGDALDHGHHTGRLGRQGPGWSEEVADGQKAPGDGATDRQGLGHGPMVRGRNLPEPVGFIAGASRPYWTASLSLLSLGALSRSLPSRTLHVSADLFAEKALGLLDECNARILEPARGQRIA